MHLSETEDKPTKFRATESLDARRAFLATLAVGLCKQTEAQQKTDEQTARAAGLAIQFLQLVDAEQFDNAILSMHPDGKSTPQQIVQQQFQMKKRRARGQLSNTRVRRVNRNTARPDGYPMYVLVESDAEFPIIYRTLIRRSTTAYLMVHLHEGQPQISVLQTDQEWQ